MTRKVPAVCACIGVLFCASPSEAKDETFGDTGQFIVSADRLFSLFSFADVNQDQIGANPRTTNTEQQTSFSLLYGATPGSTQNGSIFYTAPRLGFDYVVTSHLTVGGNVVLFSTLGGSSSTQVQGLGTTNNPNPPTIFIFGLAPRVGYVIQLSDQFAFWPRGGLSWYTASENGPGNGGFGEDQFALDLDPQFVFTPVSHFGFTGGLTADIPLTGGNSQTQAGTTLSANQTIFFLGLTVGMLGYF